MGAEESNFCLHRQESKSLPILQVPLSPAAGSTLIVNHIHLYKYVHNDYQLISLIARWKSFKAVDIYTYA